MDMDVLSMCYSVAVRGVASVGPRQMGGLELPAPWAWTLRMGA